MNALDKLIAYFAPETAFRRTRYREAVERFSYDASKAGRRTEGWVSSSGDANTETGYSLITARNRSRDLVRNNPWAAKALAELEGHVVGTGAVPRAKTE